MTGVRRGLKVAGLSLAMLMLSVSGVLAEHFTVPVENPLNNMILSGVVTINGARPPAGSEIAIYNDAGKAHMCGAFALKEAEPGKDWFTSMVVSGDSGAGDCFVEGAPLYFTFWNGTVELDQDNPAVRLEFKNNPYGSAYPKYPPVYATMGYYIVDINVLDASSDPSDLRPDAPDKVPQ